MPNVYSIHFEQIFIAEDRQRKEFSPEELIELAGSIAAVGLIHPVVIRSQGKQLILVAGERRIRALEYVWNFGDKVRCAGKEYEVSHVPCINVGEMDPIDAFEAELDENLKRMDLTWQERAKAAADLLDLRTRQANRDGTAPPTIPDIAKDLFPGREGASESISSSQDQRGSFTEVRNNLLVSRHLADPEVKKAKSLGDAMKILKRKEESRQNTKLAETVGRTLTAASHTLLQGDCIELLSLEPDSKYDVILSDPPYGINAQDFNDSGGHAGGGTDGGHFYDDSYEHWLALIKQFLPQLYRVTKPQAHIYLFCDIDNFHTLKHWCVDAGFETFRTPFIWHNPTANRAPWPEKGPHRKWQSILYAIKGGRTVTKLYPDVISVASDENLGHHAQKPVALYADLLRRSIRPGDLVLDPFCGSGPIFPAAHSLKCLATGMEMNPAAAGIAMKRLQGLV